MPVTLYPSPRQATIGEVLDAGFRIFRATLIPTLPYGVLAMVAGKLPHLYEIALARSAQGTGWHDPLWWLLYALGAMLSIAFMNAILLRQWAFASGGKSEARAVFGSGLRQMPAAAMVFILALIGVGICFTPLLSVPRAYLSWGIVVLAAPAGYVWVMLSCSWSALLVGGRGIAASLRYSVQLVRGNWWRTLTIYLIGGAMLAVFYTLAGVIAAVLVALAGTANIAVMTAVSAEVAAALAAVGVPFYVALALAVYCDLEARKAGVDLEEPVAGAAPG